jgi:hypothetical protein
MVFPSFLTDLPGMTEAGFKSGYRQKSSVRHCGIINDGEFQTYFCPPVLVMNLHCLGIQINRFTAQRRQIQLDLDV